MSQHWLPIKEPGQSLMVGYDRSRDEYFMQVRNAAGEVIVEGTGTTDFDEWSDWIASYLDTTKVELVDIESEVYMERYHGDDVSQKVVEWRNLPVREEAVRYSYGPPHLNLSAESAERAYELQTAREWRDSIEYHEGEAKETHGQEAAEHVRQAQELRALVERIEMGPRDLSPGHAGCTIASYDDCACEHISAPPLAATRDGHLDESPEGLRQRADAFEARAKMWRERPDLTREDRFIAHGLEQTAAALRTTAAATGANHDQILTPTERESVRAFVRERNASPEWELAGEPAEAVRTAAVSMLAVEAAGRTKSRHAQQRDRRVVAITADATGRDRDRHGRQFHAAKPEQAQPAVYRSHDAPRAVEIGEIRQAKATSIVGGDGKPYDLQAGRYAVVADETRDGRLQSAMIRYIVTDRATGERHAALSAVSDDRLRTLVRDGAVELHQGFTLQQLGQHQEATRLAVERDKRQQVQRSERVSLRR